MSTKELAGSASDYFEQDMECLTPEMLWEKAVALAKEDGRAGAVSRLRLTANFYLEKEDFVNEAKCVRALAEFGRDADSQNLMGVLCNRGIGLEKNDLAALYWFNKAEEQGNLQSGADCDGIFQSYSRKLSREDFAEQIGLLAHWCRTGRGPVPLDRERGAYWTGRMEKVLTGPAGERKERPS